jgi:hypothetical protein
MTNDHPSAAADVVVIGGGAAGLMCAAVAGKRGRRVILLEHNETVGRKIKISGGGRCNFTNLRAGPGHYLSEQPEFCLSALARYSPGDFVRLVESHGIGHHEKKLGQLFCDSSSDSIIGMLVRECGDAGVRIQTGCRITAVRRTDRFVLESNLGAWECKSLVIATGGLSFPKLGASDFGFQVARQFGLRVTELRPGLVPLTFGRDHPMAALSGVSLPVTVRHRSQAFSENLLWTHRGVSGPAILQISSYWRDGETLSLDLLPGLDARAWVEAHRRQGGITLEHALGRRWPQRFARTWIGQHSVFSSRPLAQLSAKQLDDLGTALSSWPLRLEGTEGYAKAEVTLGGVATSELASKNMEARRVPGLYFIGEVVDVTGWLGGYNFQWAWASAQAAGRSA